LKTQFKYVGYKYVGDSKAKIGEAKIIVNPDDIVEIDTDKCEIKNITTGSVGRQRHPDMIRGNKELGTQSLIDRWKLSSHWEEVTETEAVEAVVQEEPESEAPKRGPGRPSGSTNKGNKGG
jgi:hypothetical protein